MERLRIFWNGFWEVAGKLIDELSGGIPEKNVGEIPGRIHAWIYRNCGDIHDGYLKKLLMTFLHWFYGKFMERFSKEFCRMFLNALPKNPVGISGVISGYMVETIPKENIGRILKGKCWRDSGSIVETYLEEYMEVFFLIFISLVIFWRSALKNPWIFLKVFPPKVL